MYKMYKLKQIWCGYEDNVFLLGDGVGKVDVKKFQLILSFQEFVVLFIQQKYYVSILVFIVVFCVFVYGYVINIGWFLRYVIFSFQIIFEYIIVVCVFFDIVGNIICLC